MFVLVNFWNPPLMISVSSILAVNSIIYCFVYLVSWMVT